MPEWLLPLLLYFWRIILWLDQGLNVWFGWAFNLAMKPTAARFGQSEDELLSSVMGKNLRAGGCRGCRLMCRILDFLDPRPGSHCLQSIEDDRGDK
jgi:hypothetical protein